MDIKTIFLAFAILILSISSKQCIQKFTCGNLSALTCTNESVAADNTILVQMKPCVNQTDVCSWGNADPFQNQVINCTAAGPVVNSAYFYFFNI